MNRTSIGSRWTTPRGQYKGGWNQNPWINAMFIASQTRGESGTAVTSVHAEQKSAVRTWENEGGSLGTHQSICR